jgi:single-stranded-DNA-specific exonuclease
VIATQQPVWQVAAPTEEQVRALREAGSVSRPLALVLASRGVGPDGVGEFLHPALRSLADPYLLPGTEAAAERLWTAVQRGEHILIHGDYDTDGITASILLCTCLRQNGARAECFLPHRIDDGYGLTPESVEKARREHHTLLVTVDCGINSHDAIRFAREQGMDVIVTDHHEPDGGTSPANVAVNPKLHPQLRQLQGLAGVGVAFKLCHAFLKYGRERGLGGAATDLRAALDLVALGTVADIVPLLGENRCLVCHGLDVLSSQQRPGIRALCEVAGLGGAERIRSADITFKLAPRLNAAGRLGDPMEALRLLECRGMNDALPLAQALDEKNRGRQLLEEETLAAAEAQLAAQTPAAGRTSITVWDPQWPQGVIGIVASRLARRYHRPSIVLTLEPNGHWRGSARSIRNVNLVAVLDSCREHLVRSGGHPMAAGLSVLPDRVEAFARDFEAAVARSLGVNGIRPVLDICGRVPFAEITAPLLEEMALLEPFGHSNPEPLFLAEKITPERVFPAGRNHSRGVLADTAGVRLDFICFGIAPAALPPPPWDIAYSPQFNTYNGSSSIQKPRF